MSTIYSPIARATAGVIAAAAWLGLGLYFTAEVTRLEGNVLAALWNNLGFLTDLTNLILAIVMTGVAAGVAILSRPIVIGWAVASIVTVGVAFLMVGGRLAFGESSLQDLLLHGATPLLALAFWLFFAPKNALSWTAAFIWLTWPLLYWSYALVRGAATEHYAYPFIDLNDHSTADVATIIAALIALYLAIALTIVSLNKWLGVPAEPAATED